MIKNSWNAVQNIYHNETNTTVMHFYSFKKVLNFFFVENGKTITRNEKCRK